MPFIRHDVEPHSVEWFALRAGRITSTSAADLLAKPKRDGGERAERIALRRRLVCERLTGAPVNETYRSLDMERGSAMEPYAFNAYEARTGTVVHRVGFVSHPVYPAGYSPDGVIGDFAGLLEMKCPRATTHLSYLLQPTVPDDYRPQLLHALWLTGAAWIDFCSFDPRFLDPAQQVVIRRLTRADVGRELLSYELCLSLFLRDVERDLDALRAHVEAA